MPNVGENVRVIVQDAKTLEVLEVVSASNRIVKVGRAALGDLFLYPNIQRDGNFSNPGWTPDFIAIGTSTNTVTDNDTALATEVFRKQITRKYVSGESKYVFQLYIDATEANGSGTQILTEAGLFLLYSGGIMIARVTFSPITKNATVNVIIQWEITLTWQAA